MEISFRAIKKSIKILKISGKTVTIGSPKGYWSKGLELKDKKIGSLYRWYK